MKELSSEIHVLLNSAAQNIVLAADEYIDPADGLIHCKSCGGQRQAVIPIHGIAEHFTPRCLCPCLAIAEQRRRETEEQRKRIERIFKYRLTSFRGCWHRKILFCRVHCQCTAGQGCFRDDDKLSHHLIPPDGDVSRRAN